MWMTDTEEVTRVASPLPVQSSAHPLVLCAICLPSPAPHL